MAEKKPDETVADVSQRVEKADAAELSDIERQEREGPNRKGVMDVIASRRQELSTVGVEDNAAVYTLQELMDGAEPAFGVQPEVVAGAMRLAGATHATKAAAQNFITMFMAREV